MRGHETEDAALATEPCFACAVLTGGIGGTAGCGNLRIMINGNDQTIDDVQRHQDQKNEWQNELVHGKSMALYHQSSER